MSAFGGVFRARVARRIVWLFVLSAIVPVVLMGGISFEAVNTQLEEHSRERLGQLARNAGQSILQQILLTENALRAVRPTLSSGWLSDRELAAVPAAVSGLAIVDPDGSVRALSGTVTPPSAVETARADRLGRDELVLTRSSVDGRVLRVGLPLDPDDPTAGTLWAGLIGDSLWSAAETFVTLPSVADFCVLASPESPIYCTSGGDRLPAAFRAHFDGSVSGTFSSDEGGERLIIGQWSFYPERSFEGPPWTVMVAETSEAVYAPLGVFARTFPLALVLAILLVVLLSNVQIRRTLEPLQALAQGTERIAQGDLQARVDVRTDDEFGALAGSFNGMASRLGDQFTQFEAVQAVSQAALGAFDRDVVVVTALNEMPAVSACSAAAVLIASPNAEGAEEIAWLTTTRSLGGTSISLGPEDREWLRSNPHYGEATADFPPMFAMARKVLGDGRLVAFPHVVKGHLQGATMLAMPTGSPPLAEDAARRVRQIANQLAVALDDVRLVKELEDMSWGALVALARAIDAKSEWTAGHSERVTGMALALGREMGLNKEDLDILQRGGLLHDVGKIGVPNSVLDKAGALTPAEFDMVREHPTIGARILAPITAFAPALPLVLHHHESWDGSGYPFGLEGDEIPPLVRILTVADAFDAMASARPYRPGRPEEVVVEVLIADSGRQFDPQVIEALEGVMASRGTLYPGEVSLVSA